MRCCIQPGCHVKTRRDFEVEFYQQSLQWDKDGRIGPMPILQQPLGLMAHTEGSEIARVSSVGADLKVRVMDMVEFRIGKNASPEMVRLLLNLDEKYRKTAAQKAAEILAAN